MLESKRGMEDENGGFRMTEELIRSSIKRRKIHDSEIGELSENLLISSLADSVENSATSKLLMNDDLSSDDVKSTDLKVDEDSETVFSTFMNGEFSRESSPSGEIFGKESEEAMDSPSSTTSTKRKSSHYNCFVAKMPSTVEIDEFFSAAEKSEQQQFAKKYNYDIVKDVPIEGRYQWIPLKRFN